MSELEQKVAEQQRAMTVLLQDKANLESRVNIFVRVLQMRDEQIEQIRSGQRVRGYISFQVLLQQKLPLGPFAKVQATTQICI